MSYYNAVIDGNFLKAYELLSSETKERFPQDDFVLLQTLNRELTTLKEVKLDEGIETKDTTINNRQYDYQVEFNVVESLTDLKEKKDTTDNYKRLVVSEDKEWKVHRDGEVKKVIAQNLALIGVMYLDGQGKDMNVNEAISYYKRSLEYEENPYVTYELARALSTALRYDEALENLNKISGNDAPQDILDDVYNMMGIIAQSKNDIDGAIANYKKALEFNKDNEYAKTNLTALEEYKKLFSVE